MELEQTREERIQGREKMQGDEEKTEERKKKISDRLQNKLRRREGWLWVFVGG